jgi:SAM-dependent methyltransferase
MGEQSCFTPNPSASDWAAARGEQWAAQLSGMEAQLAPVNEPLLGALQLAKPTRIAEIGCGGGGTAIELLRRAPAGSVVHGFDISPRLVGEARGRVPPGEGALAFEVADMGTAAPPGQLYDRLVSRFGIMFFEDPQSAFANLVRWLEPGGRFAFAVWGAPAENRWFTSVRDVVARIVEVPPADPDAPGPFRYADAGTLLALLERAGFGRLEVHDWRGMLPIGGELSPGEAAHFSIAAFSSFGALLAKAGDEALHEARRALADRLSDHVRDGAVRLEAYVHLVTGAR